MRQVRIIIEYAEEGHTPSMRWERRGASAGGGTFELLGRAFEVAQREEAGAEGTGFALALAAFFRGAIVRKEDVAEVLQQME